MDKPLKHRYRVVIPTAAATCGRMGVKVLSFDRDVYIVYTEKYDLQVAANLWAMLTARGYSVFYAPRTEAPAAEYEKQMERHMAGSRIHLILTSSQPRTGASRLYEAEIKIALAAGRVLPVLVDGHRQEGVAIRSDLGIYNALFAEDLTLAGVVDQVANQLGEPQTASLAASQEALKALDWGNLIETGDRALMVSADADANVDEASFSAVEKVGGPCLVSDIDGAVRRLVIGMNSSRAIHVFLRAPYPTAVVVGACLEARARNHPIFLNHFSPEKEWRPLVLPPERFRRVVEEEYFLPMEQVHDAKAGSGAVLFLASQWQPETPRLIDLAGVLGLRRIFVLSPPPLEWQLRTLAQASHASRAIERGLEEIQRVTQGGGLCIGASGPAALVAHAAYRARARVVGPIYGCERDPASRSYKPSSDLRPAL